MKKVKNMVPVLFVKNAGKAKDFYVDVLGLTVKADFGGLNYVFEEGFAVWQPMEENIIPEKLGQSIFDANAVSRVEICFETDDIESVYKKLKGSDVKFLHEMNVELWGQRTLRFYDPEGHLIEVGEELEVFVRRIYEEENDVEAAAKRVFMSPDMAKNILGL